MAGGCRFLITWIKTSWSGWRLEAVTAQLGQRRSNLTCGSGGGDWYVGVTPQIKRSNGEEKNCPGNLSRDILGLGGPDIVSHICSKRKKKSLSEDLLALGLR